MRMEYEAIKKLIDDMGNSKLTALDIEFPDGTKISAKKEMSKTIVQSNEVSLPKVEIVKEIEEEHINKEDENKQIIKSPMVGTFYMKPSPTSNPYVEVGSNVKKGDVVCIIEAMKLMNEIESEFDGEIVEIFVKDGEAVEYGKPLFAVR